MYATLRTSPAVLAGRLLACRPRAPAAYSAERLADVGMKHYAQLQKKPAELATFHTTLWAPPSLLESGAYTNEAAEPPIGASDPFSTADFCAAVVTLMTASASSDDTVRAVLTIRAGIHAYLRTADNASYFHTVIPTWWIGAAALLRVVSQMEYTPDGPVDFSRIRFGDCPAALLQAALSRSDGSNFEYASFEGLRLPCTNFRGAFLRHTDMTSVVLNGSDFSGADMVGARLASAQLTDVTLPRTAQRLADLESAIDLQTVHWVD